MSSGPSLHNGHMNREEPQRCFYYISVDLVSYIQVLNDCDIYDFAVWFEQYQSI